MENMHARFDAIDERLDRLEAGQMRLEVGQASLEAGHSGLRADVVRLETTVGGLETKVGGLETKVGGLEIAVVRLETKVDTNYEQLSHQMRVLHEDAIDRIKAIPTDVPSRVEMRQWFMEFREDLSRRLDPLEVAVQPLIRRQH
jgi:chromosome segregation ATPase